MMRLFKKDSQANCDNAFILRVAGVVLTALLATGGIANAQECSSGMLSGWYSAYFHTDRLGLLTGNPETLAPFPTVSLVDGLSVYDFDGIGRFQATVYAERDGAPNTPAGTPGLTKDGFGSQTGTYHINPDCTGGGTMSQSGLRFAFVIVLGDHGRTFRITASAAHADTIPGNPNCTNGCDLAIQVTQQGERIFSSRQ
jgi:hypothetical protein